MFKKTIFFFLIFCLPFQLGYHFWLPQSFVSSFRIDYLSPTLYLTDLLILCYLATNLRHIKTNPLFLALVIFNLLITKGNPITLFAWFRLLEYYFLFQALRSESNLINKAKKPFLTSLYLILTLALLQFIRQSSIGGPLYYLGERPLSVFLPNIAKLNLPSAICYLPSAVCRVLRPYSTFSHPNSLAGYLLVCLILLPLFTKSKFIKTLTSIVIVLTFSKTAILALFLITLFQPSFLQSLILGVFLSLTPLITYLISLPSWLQLSFASRHYFFLPTLQMIKNHWSTGVGLRQFIPSLAERLPVNQLSYQSLQPVHNFFLLVITEIGLLPILIICFYFLKSKITLNTKYLPAGRHGYPLATIILITGSLDHYWWTLPQNQLIIVLAIALISNSLLSSPNLGEEAPLRRRGEVKIPERNYL